MMDYMNLIDKVDIPELVKALRECASDDPDCIYNCPYYNHDVCADDLKSDAAAAIEELQNKVVELEEELNDADVAADDNGRQVEELQVEVERLKDSNEELRER